MRLDRRRFLQTSILGTGAALAGCTRDGTDAAVEAPDDDGRAAPPPLAYVPFHGAHQPGIAHPSNAQGLLAAFRCTAGDREELTGMFRTLSLEARRLMQGEPYEERDPAYPPLYTGAVGNPPPPADLSVIVSVGASLFDERFELAERDRDSSSRCPSWPTTSSTPPGPTATC